jgi:hypothetical protein
MCTEGRALPHLLLLGVELVRVEPLDLRGQALLAITSFVLKLLQLGGGILILHLPG